MDPKASQVSVHKPMVLEMHLWGLIKPDSPHFSCSLWTPDIAWAALCSPHWKGRFSGGQSDLSVLTELLSVSGRIRACCWGFKKECAQSSQHRLRLLCSGQFPALEVTNVTFPWPMWYFLDMVSSGDQGPGLELQGGCAVVLCPSTKLGLDLWKTPVWWWTTEWPYILTFWAWSWSVALGSGTQGSSRGEPSSAWVTWQCESSTHWPAQWGVPPTHSIHTST